MKTWTKARFTDLDVNGVYRDDDRGETAKVFKDPKRFGYRGKYRNIELFFVSDADTAMGILDREIARAGRDNRRGRAAC